MGTDGGYIVVLGNPAFEYEHPGFGARPFMAWSPFKFKWVKGKGDSLRLGDSGKNSIYGSYLARTTKYEYSFSRVSPSTDILDKYSFQGYTLGVNTSAYIRNRADYICAASIWLELNETSYPHDVKRWLSGEFVMLPVTADGAVANIVDIVTLKEEAPKQMEPDWTADISVVGQDEIDERIHRKQEAIKKAKSELSELISTRKELRGIVRSLYESDKSLEQSVKVVLKDLGSTIGEPSIANKIEFYLNFGELRFAPEVKSTLKEHIEQKGLRQAIDWSNDAFDETGEDHKPLLIVSNQYNKPPGARLANPLEPNLVSYAETRKICVLTVQTLFQAHQQIMSGSLTAEAFFEALNDCSGLFLLQDKAEPQLAK